MMWKLYNSLFNWINHLDPQGWLAVLVAGMVVGAICMRGLGLRSRD